MRDLRPFKNRRYMCGFTLVELAISLIIMGLLIGSVLKGTDLIESARAMKTVTQIRSLQIAVSTFKDAYDGYPGDSTQAEKRIPDCDASPCKVTNSATLGNGIIEGAPGDPMVLGQENVAFFVQLYRGGLLDGLDGENQLLLKNAILPAQLGNGPYFRVGFVDRPSLVPGTRLGGALNLRAGHWLAIFGAGISPETDVGGADITYDAAVAIFENNGFTPKTAQRMDIKFDDSNPNNGLFVAANVGGDADIDKRCALNGLNADYNTRNNSNDCAVYIRFSE